MGTYKTPWDAKSELIASDELAVLAWKGSTISPALKAQTISAPKLAGNHVGEIYIAYGEQQKTVPVELKNDLLGPDWHWRLFR